MKKKLVSIFCTLLLVLGGAVGLSACRYRIEENGIIYRHVSYIFDSPYYKVESITDKTATEIVIPSRVKDYPVQEICAQVFKDCTALKSVTLPDRLKLIGERAFSGCTELTSIAIPDSVTRIGYRAFGDCTSLTQASIGKGLEKIPDEIFQNCTSLTNITIPDGVREIGAKAFEKTAFYNDENNWENDVLFIGEYLIRAKASLSGDYAIKEGTKLIANNAFEDCRKLTGVTFPESITSISSSAFSGCTALTSVTIPNSVAEIGNYAFSYCTALTSITIPDDVTRICDGVFQFCTSLENVNLHDHVSWIGDKAFQSCTSLASITIPDIPYRVSHIGNKAFENTAYYNDENNWEGNVLYLGQFLLTAKTSIAGGYAIKEGTKYMADFAFYDCASLKSVTIPNGVVGIPESAFSGCRELKSVTIPTSVRWIKDEAFYPCASLKSVTYRGTKADWSCVSKVYWYHTRNSYKVFTIHCTDGDIIER